jgi:hypothetical protein
MAEVKKSRYAVHPGYVRSRTDGQQHYVGFADLVRLYGVPPGRCVLWDDDRRETYAGRNHDEFVHLRPRSSGDYSLAPEDEIAE